MLLKELKWKVMNDYWDLAVVTTKYKTWRILRRKTPFSPFNHFTVGNYWIGSPADSSVREAQYQDIEPLMAQAVIFEILKESNPRSN